MLREALVSDRQISIRWVKMRMLFRYRCITEEGEGFGVSGQ